MFSRMANVCFPSTGTVCDDYWDQEDALVVCTQLGIIGEATAVQGGRFGQGSFRQPIWLDNVRCTGSEMYLSDCDSQGFGSHNCAHYEDAGVVCEGLFKVIATCTHKYCIPVA